jgi:hypothetical protein
MTPKKRFKMYPQIQGYYTIDGVQTDFTANICHAHLLNYILFAFSNFTYPGAYPGFQTNQLRNTANAPVSPSFSSNQININAIAGDDTKGLLFGLGSTAISPTQINLSGAKIAEGTGVNQLNYQLQSSWIQNTFNSNYLESLKFWFERKATNNSGANIDAKEIGLISSDGVDSLLLFRFPYPITIPDTKLITLRFCWNWWIQV